MAGMKDSFFGDTFYPARPGYKTPGTSKDAAQAAAGRAETLRNQVLTVITNAGYAGLTADEAAQLIGETVLAVRPRVTELSKTAKIEKTGVRRANASGMSANVWRAKRES